MKIHSTGPRKNFPFRLEVALPAGINEGLFKGETPLIHSLNEHWLSTQVTLAVTLGIEMREIQLLPVGT